MSLLEPIIQPNEWKYLLPYLITCFGPQSPRGGTRKLILAHFPLYVHHALIHKQKKQISVEKVENFVFVVVCSWGSNPGPCICCAKCLTTELPAQHWCFSLILCCSLLRRSTVFKVEGWTILTEWHGTFLNCQTQNIPDVVGQVLSPELKGSQ